MFILGRKLFAIKTVNTEVRYCLDLTGFLHGQTRTTTLSFKFNAALSNNTKAENTCNSNYLVL